MTITVDITPEVEQRLRTEAEARGKTVNALIAEAVETQLLLSRLNLREILAPVHADFHNSAMSAAELDKLLQEALDETRATRRAMPGQSA